MIRFCPAHPGITPLTRRSGAHDRYSRWEQYSGDRLCGGTVVRASLRQPFLGRLLRTEEFQLHEPPSAVLHSSLLYDSLIWR